MTTYTTEQCSMMASIMSYIKDNKYRCYPDLFDDYAGPGTWNEALNLAFNHPKYRIDIDEMLLSGPTTGQNLDTPRRYELKAFKEFFAIRDSKKIQYDRLLTKVAHEMFIDVIRNSKIDQDGDFKYIYCAPPKYFNGSALKQVMDYEDHNSYRDFMFDVLERFEITYPQYRAGYCPLAATDDIFLITLR